MSVLIKGMAMPKNCCDCPCFNEFGYYFCNLDDERRDVYDDRPEWCPLVALPKKHGDLIDRDEVRNAVFHHLSIKGEENLLPAEKSVFGNIIKAEAVIESEGE